MQRGVPATHGTRKVLTAVGPSARPKRRRRPLARDRSGVLAAFRRVGAGRRPGPPTWDPTRAQRTSNRRHGATRHDQRRAAFDARRPEAQAAALAALRVGDLRDLEPLAHKRLDRVLAYDGRST